MRFIQQILSFAPASCCGKSNAIKIHSSELLPRQANKQLGNGLGLIARNQKSLMNKDAKASAKLAGKASP
jgi:hypothetical protein